MYQLKEISLRELFEKGITREQSVKALRSRANERIVVFTNLDVDGRTRLYDEQLSMIRAITARKIKNSNPKISWGLIQRTFEKLDNFNFGLNEKIIELLNNNSNIEEVFKSVEKIMLESLHENGHIY